MDDCLFCKIGKKEIPAQIVYEDEAIMAFRDIKPVAPVHILLIPKKHIADFTALEEEDATLLGNLLLAAKKVAKAEGLEENGFRVINNCKQHGGQVVYHLHFHLLGGRQLTVLG